MRAAFRILTAGLVALGLWAAPAAAQQQTTPARAAIVIDLASGAVLLEKNADEPLPPASMSKLMTLYMVFEAIDTGRLSLGDEFRTSAHAASIGGSKMFIREGGVVSVADLLRGVIVQSGNDAAVALAEAIAGSEAAFADLMTRRAHELGLENSTFANATGWPNPNHMMSVRDLAELAIHIIEEFPQFYPMFAERQFTWADITQENRNPLLGAGLGVDGLKTGHTEEAGYGLVASAERTGRRVVTVVTGLDSAATRQRETERLINWAFRAFETETLFPAGEPVAEAEVWIGSTAAVPVAPARDVVVTALLGALEEAEITVHYDGPLPAPIARGDEVGRLEIALPDMPTQSVPLVAAEDVGEGGFLTRVQGAAEILFRRAVALAKG